MVESDPELKRALQDKLVDAEAIQRALRDPARRDEIRRLVLGDEWVEIPNILRQLVETQRQQTAQLAALIETQQRHEAILRELIETQQRHEAILRELIETQQRHEAILQEHTRILQEHSSTLQEHSRILQEHSRILQEHSRILQEHSRILQEHSRILQEHTQQLAMLIETQQRHEAILQEHTRILQEHTNLLVQAGTEVRSLRDRVAGLAGQLEGEKFERSTVRRAPNIFLGGGGGSPESPIVRSRLKQWLKQVRRERRTLSEQSDPYLADIIWWKDGNVLVVEVSVKIDRLDVLRAKYRAQTLRDAGVNATPVVIGREWSMDETRELAQREGVEWILEEQFSDGMIPFRQIPEAEEDAED